MDKVISWPKMFEMHGDEGFTLLKVLQQVKHATDIYKISAVVTAEGVVTDEGTAQTFVAGLAPLKAGDLA